MLSYKSPYDPFSENFPFQLPQTDCPTTDVRASPLALGGISLNQRAITRDEFPGEREEISVPNVSAAGQPSMHRANAYWKHGQVTPSADKLREFVSNCRSKNLTPRRIARLADKLVSYKISDPEILQEVAFNICNLVIKKGDSFSPSQLATTLLAFAIANRANSSRKASTTQKANPRYRGEYFAWSNNGLSYRAEYLIKRATELAVKSDKVFSPTNQARVLWALAQFNYRDENLLATFSDATISSRSLFTPKDIAGVAWAFASLNYHDDALTSELRELVISQRGDFCPQSLAAIAWAFAVFNPSFLPDIVTPSDLDSPKLSTRGIQQMYSAMMAGDIIAPRPDLDSRFTSRIQGSQNGFERNVGSFLLGTFPTSNFLHNQFIGGLEWDWLQEIGSKRVLWECDGEKFHTTRGPHGGCPKGKQLVRERVAQALGLGVVHIDDTSWESAPNKVAYLWSRFNQTKLP